MSSTTQVIEQFTTLDIGSRVMLPPTVFNTMLQEALKHSPNLHEHLKKLLSRELKQQLGMLLNIRSVHRVEEKYQIPPTLDILSKIVPLKDFNIVKKDGKPVIEDKQPLILIKCENGEEILVNQYSGLATFYHNQFLIDDNGEFRHPDWTLCDVFRFIITLPYWWSGKDPKTNQYFISDKQVEHIKRMICSYMPKYEYGSFTLRPHQIIDDTPYMIFTVEEVDHYLSVNKNEDGQLSMSLKTTI